MKRNAFRQLRLVNNLLDITKLDSEQFKLNLKEDNKVKVNRWSYPPINFNFYYFEKVTLFIIFYILLTIYFPFKYTC